jgi:flavin-dependent dehydrogenase
LTKTVDVAVVGGGIAGCGTAILFSQMGHRVAVLEKKTVDEGRYKRLCTHFIQPSAVPVLTALGLDELREPASSIRTTARFTTPGGVIDAPGGYRADSYALNLERRVLDPALRDAARRAGADLFDATAIDRMERDASGWWSLDTSGGAGARHFRARLLVAADGRESWVAGRLGNPTTRHANERAARFGYFAGIAAPPGNRSLFIHHEREMAFVYPLIGGRTLLSLYVEKPRAEAWRRSSDPVAEFLRYFDGLADVPPCAGAEPETELLGYGDYPNVVRQPVWDSVPFVGDASLSLDPMSGVGCGFALQSADLLARSFAGRSLSATGIQEGLAAYGELHARVIQPHADGICADSLVGKNAEAQARTFRTIGEDAELSQRYLALTGRLILPADFQRALMRALVQRRGAGSERSPKPRATITPIGSDAGH